LTNSRRDSSASTRTQTRTDVARLVNEEYSRFDGRPIRDYIPLFVERNPAAQLSKPESVDGPVI